MKRVNQIVAALFLCFAGFEIFQASKLRYYSTLGPGPGFFPLWLGILFAILTVLWLVQVSRSGEVELPKDFFPARDSALRVAAVLLALALVTFTLDLIGFRLIMLVMLGFLLTALGRQNLLVTVVIAVLGSFGLHYALTTWLGMSLPNASIEFLTRLGL